MFYLRGPWKQTILLMLMASVIVAGTPQTAFADAPTYDPVFYYYHTDHLGSSTVLTNRDGELVQHYGYTAFGYEQYKHNTSAFSVTNRYTGQQLDEDTGLYFYKSRYYDPQLARFTQADSVVPSASTSQALNRYTYVKNNPLKFTDPSGHGWFSDIFKSIGNFIKQYIGMILTVLLTPGLGILYASLIGSAVATAVNGGTFASFAVGVGIGIAAGLVAGAAGDGLFGAGWAEGATAANAAWQDAALYNVMASAAGGAISSAVYGGNAGKAALRGAGIGAATSAASWAAGEALGSLQASSQASSQGSQEEQLIQACVMDMEDYYANPTVDFIDFCEFADAWLTREQVYTIPPKGWDKLLENARSIVRGKSKWKIWKAMEADIGYDKDHALYYIPSIGKISRGTEINYIGEGMFFNHNWLGGKGDILPHAWKWGNMGWEKVTGTQLDPKRLPYKSLTRDERFYFDYGHANFNK